MMCSKKSTLIWSAKSYEVFGRPGDFYRVLEPWEFEEDVATEEIEMGIETAEELPD